MVIENIIKRTSIFGLGLLGGSVALRIKRIDPSCAIRVYARDPLKTGGAVKLGMADEIYAMDEIDLSDQSLIIIAAPIIPSLDIIRLVLNNKTLNPEALVMDVGSVKKIIIETALLTSAPERFAGCHPMAGSEKSGYKHSTGDLYVNSHVFITPSEANAPEVLRAAEGFWSLMGADCSFVTPGEHDRIVAYTSHLPHFSASAIAAVLSRASEKRIVPEPDMLAAFIGKGFMDTTRVSKGSPGMWGDIAVHNKNNIIDSIDDLIEELLVMKRLINSRDENEAGLVNYLEEIKRFRSGIK